MNLSKSKKIKIVELKENGFSYKKISRETKLSLSTISEFLNIWRYHGEKAFVPWPKHRRYAPAFKLMLINLHSKGQSTWELAGKYNVDKMSVNQWCKIYQKFGYNGLIRKTKGLKTTLMNDKKDKKSENVAQKITTEAIPQGKNADLGQTIVNNLIDNAPKSQHKHRKLEEKISKETADMPNDKEKQAAYWKEKFLELRYKYEVASAKIALDNEISKLLDAELKKNLNLIKTTSITNLSKYFDRLLLFVSGNFSSSTYYENVARAKRPDKDEQMKTLVLTEYSLHQKRYGYRRITKSLNQKAQLFAQESNAADSINKPINHKRVRRLMLKLGIKGLFIKKPYRSFKGGTNKRFEHLLLNGVWNHKKNKWESKPNFKADKPYNVFVTDITMFSLNGFALYFSPLIDLYNHEVVAYTISTTPDADMVCRMIKKAVKVIGKQKLRNAIIHSDQGCQYTSDKYIKLLESLGVHQSMSRRGRSSDNSIAENLFSRLKREMFHHCQTKFKTVLQLTKEIVEYIKYYNNERICLTACNGRSPIHFRQLYMNNHQSEQYLNKNPY